MAENGSYVTNQAWVRTVGRPDTIDEVADEFERRAVAVQLVASQPDPATVVADQVAQWPRRSRGWRSIGRLHPQVREHA